MQLFESSGHGRLGADMQGRRVTATVLLSVWHGVAVYCERWVSTLDCNEMTDGGLRRANLRI
jgi:hypothetical protein